MLTVTYKELLAKPVAELIKAEEQPLHICLVEPGQINSTDQFVLFEEIKDTDEYMLIKVQDLRGNLHQVKIGDRVAKDRRGTETWTLIP